MRGECERQNAAKDAVVVKVIDFASFSGRRKVFFRDVQWLLA
jgi:hypothetical protein